MGGNTAAGDGRPAWAVLSAHFSACRPTVTDGTRKVVMGQANSREQPPEPPPETGVLRLGSHWNRVAWATQYSLDDDSCVVNILAGDGDRHPGIPL